MTTENAASRASAVFERSVRLAPEPRHRSMRLGTAAGKTTCRWWPAPQSRGRSLSVVS